MQLTREFTCDECGTMQYGRNVEIVPYKWSATCPQYASGPKHPTRAQVEQIVDGWKGELLQKVLAGHEHVRPSESTHSILVAQKHRSTEAQRRAAVPAR